MHAIVLACAGVLAGIVGTAGAITSLVSYPALLLVGVAPLAAAIANVVALSTAWPGSALTSRRELAGRGGWVLRYGAVAAAGGTIGAVLLLSTPAGAFGRIVPFLVAAGALALAFSPRLQARRRSRRREPRPGRAAFITAGAVLAMSVYGGYLGAGSGVMLLSLCLVMTDDPLPVANACKNMLVGADTLVAALVLVVWAHVDWGAVVPLGLGVLVGSTIGPLVARRLPARALRMIVTAVGLGFAVQLWVSHGG